MKFTLCLAVYAVAAYTARAGPVPPPSAFADVKAERESADFNEVGPAEDWTLMRRLSKTNAFDGPASDSEKSRALAKEIEEFTRFVKSANGAAEDATETTEDGRPQDDEAAVTEPDAASSDWTGAAWRSLKTGDAPSDRQQAAAAAADDDDGNFEDIVKKISNDLKKLYVKIKQVMNVVKDWVNAARGQRSGFDDEPYPLTASASESDGVFVIADPLTADPLTADVDKSNKYTVPIHAD